MLTRLVRAQPRTSIIRMSMPVRQYSEKFKERETASENMYIRKHEEEKLKALAEQLKKAEQNLKDVKEKLEEHINNKKDANSK
ncbi:hypothetical protein EV182_003758 [Spiromyces aspiralis]|uniref:Uncharacterized protein n=1 Tax=Spiromyces aspiralis TaxID=68401 RepID=A0ACC1HPY8_9FUNG|nr:hypothetical protein EV182_003758 [Spiromyces aspiralis]